MSENINTLEEIQLRDNEGIDIMAAYGELKCDLTSFIPKKHTDRCASYKKNFAWKNPMRRER